MPNVREAALSESLQIIKYLLVKGHTEVHRAVPVPEENPVKHPASRSFWNWRSLQNNLFEKKILGATAHLDKQENQQKYTKITQGLLFSWEYWEN